MGTRWPAARKGFTRALSAPRGQLNLPLAALFIAAEEHPGLDIVCYLGRIAGLAERVRKRLPPRRSLYDSIHAVSHVLYEEEGFAGNTEEYEDPRNSYLSDVLDRRLGIPISLSVIFQEVARQAGQNLRGVGMPGHFLLAGGHGESEIFIDPFDRGALLSRRECLAIATRGKKLPQASMPVLARRLLPTNGPRSILRRILLNLKLTHTNRKEFARALASAERIQIIEPTDWRNLGDLAHIHTELGQFSLAVTSLTAFLERAPAGVDLTSARNALEQLRALAANGGHR